MFKKQTPSSTFNHIEHIAFIMDGNRRWAKQRMLPTSFGHREGVKRIKETLYLCENYDIKVMTIFCFSTENWKRDKKEVNYLFSLFDEFFVKNIDELNKKGCRIRFMGNINQIPESTKINIKKAENLTINNKKITLNLCINYGGRDEIVSACKSIANKVKNNLLTINEINEELFEKNMMCGGLPPVDVMVRTSGEQRLSNFVLWELSYAELIFIKEYWPDFKEKQFIEVLQEYTNRNRRYGGTNNGN